MEGEQGLSSRQWRLSTRHSRSCHKWA